MPLISGFLSTMFLIMDSSKWLSYDSPFDQFKFFLYQRVCATLTPCFQKVLVFSDFPFLCSFFLFSIILIIDGFHWIFKDICFLNSKL